MSDNLPAELPANLPSTFEGLSDDELMLATGQGQEMGLGLPSLRVNYDDEDSDGNSVPRGQWTIQSDGTQYFAKDVSLRVLYSTYQYSHYDADEGKMVSKSVHFTRFGEEVYDDAGGKKCGKVKRKDFESLSKSEQKVQKKIKLSKVLFGVVTLTGVDNKGKKATLKNEPCVFYARGTNYMPMSDLIQDMHNSKKVMQRTQLLLELKREKNDGVTYWSAVPAIEKEGVEVTTDDYELMRKFALTAHAESEDIFNKWRAIVIKNSAGQKDVADKINAKVEDGDDIPFDDSTDDIGLDPDQTVLSAG